MLEIEFFKLDLKKAFIESLIFVYLQIQQIIDRILSFPVNQPLMKYLTGLEILLRQSQVSLYSAFLDNLASKNGNRVEILFIRRSSRNETSDDFKNEIMTFIPNYRLKHL